MTGLHHEAGIKEIRSGLVRDARAVVPALIEHIAPQIQHKVPTYAGPIGGRRHRLITMASTAAASHFLDSIERPDASGRRVDELFRRMGHGEAVDGHDLDSIHAAIRIVTREAWNFLSEYASDHRWPATALGSIGNALLAYTDHLSAQAALGYDGALRAIAHDPSLTRERLTEALLRRTPLTELHPLALEAGWPIPASVVVVGVVTATDEGVPDLTALSDLPDSYLVRVTADSAVILCSAAERAKLLDVLSESALPLRAALSWSVPPDEISDAWRWVNQGLELVARGVIAPAPVIHLSEYRTQLWLHSEPLLRQRLCQELLRPLLAETPNSREILSETLLAWLESRDSAPAIAARLGVHAQTVRYRWKRINELFGDALREPEFVVQVTMLLKASVPLWKAGDQSDFERFRTEDSE